MANQVLLYCSVVNILSFYYDNMSSKPFLSNVCWTKMKKKEPGVSPQSEKLRLLFTAI